LSQPSVLLACGQMLRFTSWFVLLVTSYSALANEQLFDFSKYPLNHAPSGFQSLLSGTGRPGDWKVIADKEPWQAPSTPGATNHAVLAQLSQDGTDEHFPLLVYQEESFGDFTLTARFKIVDGLFEQMAGLAFRIQDTNNYYYVRASALGNNFRFVKLVNGQRLTTLGPSIEVTRNVWHEITVECQGNRIRCLFDAKEIIPPLTDNTFLAGKIGFWTKSDAVSYFGETKLTFTPRVTLAQVLVKEAIKRYPRLLGLKIFSLRGEDKVPTIVASSHDDEIGVTGGSVERNVINNESIYYGKEKGAALVTMPLHDRNGDIAAAVRVVMQSFPGQTEQNALARAQPIIKEMEQRIRNAKDLLQ